MSHPSINVLFVCLGNICRSPLAEGAFRARVDAANLSHRFFIDSAGTGHWHAGEAPDPRSIATAQSHGVDISGQRARQLQRSDLTRFQHIFAMDQSNLRIIREMATDDSAAINLFLSETSALPTEVPDPYYGGDGQFELVWQMVDEAAAALLSRLTGVPSRSYSK